VFRVRRCGIGVAYDLHLVRLQHSPNRVEEEACIFWCPKVQVYCVESVHVFALVRRVGRGQMPLRRVLVRAGASTVTLKGVDCEGEQAWMFVRVLDLDCVQIYATGQLVFEQGMSQHSRPEKAS
jgi:hypothetical protein